jgi:putative phosphoesterase
MLVPILSDSHDNLDTLRTILAQCKERGFTNGIHLGDFCSPFSVDLLVESGITWTCVWGNNDGDRLRNTIRASHGAVHMGENDFREVEMEGKKLFLTHYPEIGRIAALSGQYDAVFHGHNHVAAQEVIMTEHCATLLANPGEVCGWRFGKPSFGIYNTESNTFEIIWL